MVAISPRWGTARICVRPLPTLPHLNASTSPLPPPPQPFLSVYPVPDPSRVVDVHPEPGDTPPSPVNFTARCGAHGRQGAVGYSGTVACGNVSHGEGVVPPDAREGGQWGGTTSLGNGG